MTLPLKGFSGLAIEGELAVRLVRDISQVDLSSEELLRAIDCVFPVIELHNYIFRRNEPSAEELIANNAIHAGFVYSTSPISTWDFEPYTIKIKVDDVIVASIPGTLLSSTVVESMSWLAKELTRQGLGMKAGQTILCGSVADLIPVSHGCRISVATDRFGSVECMID